MPGMPPRSRLRALGRSALRRVPGRARARVLGAVGSRMGFAGSEIDLLARGLVSSGYLDGLKARVLLSLTLARGADIEAVQATFEEVNEFR